MNPLVNSIRSTLAFARSFALGLLLAAALLTTGRAADSIRVMTFNIWVGGESGGQPLTQTAEVIRKARADIVGLQETHTSEKAGKREDSARAVAAMLGWHYFDQGERTGILSRFPIITNTPAKWGVLVRLNSGAEVWMFNAHLMHAPYQPYQLLNIPYADAPFIKTAAEAVAEARKARGGQVERLLAELKPALASGKPVFLTGDMNEPSHQDWTPRAAQAGKVPIAVEYPTSLAITRAGMTDAFRAAFPNEVEVRGDTWTPITAPDDPKDRHDRIDFVFLGGKGLKVERCEVIGEDKRFADIIVQSYPSDHRAVVATIQLP
ncbi:MAG: endonuclease/exonuclease/phosphatase family protein [Limisphaerales bacterium]